MKKRKEINFENFVSKKGRKEDLASVSSALECHYNPKAGSYKAHVNDLRMKYKELFPVIFENAIGIDLNYMFANDISYFRERYMDTFGVITSTKWIRDINRYFAFEDITDVLTKRMQEFSQKRKENKLLLKKGLTVVDGVIPEAAQSKMKNIKDMAKESAKYELIRETIEANPNKELDKEILKKFSGDEVGSVSYKKALSEVEDMKKDLVTDYYKYLIELIGDIQSNSKAGNHKVFKLMDKLLHHYEKKILNAAESLGIDKNVRKDDILDTGKNRISFLVTGSGGFRRIEPERGAIILPEIDQSIREALMSKYCIKEFDKVVTSHELFDMDRSTSKPTPKEGGLYDESLFPEGKYARIDLASPIYIGTDTDEVLKITSIPVPPPDQRILDCDIPHIDKLFSEIIQQSAVLRTTLKTKADQMEHLFDYMELTRAVSEFVKEIYYSDDNVGYTMKKYIFTINNIKVEDDE